jgi:methylase of polypeptide subunit release factors
MNIPYWKRDKFVENYAWAIPNKESINEIIMFANGEKILEIGAGLGYWAMRLKKKNIDIIATDLCDNAWRHNKNQKHSEVLKFSHLEAIESFPNAKVLFICWPPFKNEMASEALESFRGNKLIYIGESKWGCCATDKFFDNLWKNWINSKNIYISTFKNIYDYVSFWVRK